MNGPRWWALWFMVGGLFWVSVAALCVWLAMPKAGGFTPDRPPAEFRDGRRVTVVFSDKSEFLCMLAGAPNRFACASPATNTMYLPNPCNQKGAWPNPLACHEMAHTVDLRGKFWPADHPK